MKSTVDKVNYSNTLNIIYIHEINYKFRERVLPFYLETTIVIHVTLYIYSCVANVTGNYIGETSNRLRLRLNNHKKSIRDNSRGFPVAVHFNLPYHSLKNLRCVILRRDFKTTADRLICEQTLIHKFKTHSKGVNKDLSFLSPYLHQCCRPLTSTSNNNTEV